MNNNTKPPVLETKKIIKATIISVVVAAIILVIAVLPAEYGIDITGAGHALGFSKLADTSQKKSIAEETTPSVIFKEIKLEDLGSSQEVAKPVEANNPPPAKQYENREDSIQIKVPAGKGLEYKVLLLKYGTLKYEWKTDDGFVFFDFHGEVKESNPPKDVFFESYTVSNATNIAGTFLAPFEGRHGWYFKNRNAKDMIIKLRLKGEYALTTNH